MFDASIWLTVAAIFVLICFSAFFSGSETAMTSVSRGKLRAQSDRGDRAALRALKITDNRENLIGAVLLGNNFVNTLAAALATSLFTRVYGEPGVAIATIVMTALILVFAEIMPKSYAISNPESAARRLSRPISAVMAVFSPVVGVVQLVVVRFLGLLGVRPDSESELAAVEEEIAGTIALGHQSGAVEKEHRDRLLGALDLGNRTVEEIMLHRSEIEIIDADASMDEIIRICSNSQYTRLPVCKGEIDNIVGVVHAKDLLRKTLEIIRDASSESGWTAKLNLIELAMKPYFVPETTTLDEQMRHFLVRHSHFALVVDEYGALQVLITLEDILEEIVGEITDEHDANPDLPFTRDPDGGYLVEGATPIRDLNREMDWRLPEDNANTVAGLVIHEAQAIPTVGQEFNFHGFRFEVMNREANRITRLRLRQL